MEKFYEENCLYEQHFIRDESVTVKEMIDQAIAKVGREDFCQALCTHESGRRHGNLRRGCLAAR